MTHAMLRISFSRSKYQELVAKIEKKGSSKHYLNVHVPNIWALCPRVSFYKIEHSFRFSHGPLPLLHPSPDVAGDFEARWKKEKKNLASY